MAEEHGDPLLDTAARKEMLSIAYVRAVAAQAGYAVSPGHYPDRDSVDLQIRAGGTMHPSLDLQLKATTVLGESRNGSFSFRLKVSTYDDLRNRTLVPRLLVVLDLPGNQEDWLEVTPENLVLRRCAYWMSLCGLGTAIGEKSVTVHIPEENVFDTEQLRRLIQRARTGDLQ